MEDAFNFVIEFGTKILLIVIIGGVIRGLLGGSAANSSNSSRLQNSWASSAPAYQPGDNLGEIVGNKVRVRNWPDTQDDSNIIGVVHAGDIVFVETTLGYHVSGRIGRDAEGAWLKIRNADQSTGYIAAKFIRRFVAE